MQVLVPVGGVGETVLGMLLGLLLGDLGGNSCPWVPSLKDNKGFLCYFTTFYSNGLILDGGREPDETFNDWIVIVFVI
jgi:hypothetical protein